MQRFDEVFFLFWAGAPRGAQSWLSCAGRWAAGGSGGERAKHKDTRTPINRGGHTKGPGTGNWLLKEYIMSF